ncbi:hypothetical protein BDA99DRAFT_540982 [Phascolomyces articulosus]|uniref:Uncharacterized protein n=1 Tax=Phascolomyces articulosus TaxID=60185 RepID=A0AAD5PAA0_9FUNG|nr:hypothetical protein BDA99DRAFT_540982 [Phascolomyces articulosus]
MEDDVCSDEVYLLDVTENSCHALLPNDPIVVSVLGLLDNDLENILQERNNIFDSNNQEILPMNGITYSNSLVVHTNDNDDSDNNIPSADNPTDYPFSFSLSKAREAEIYARIAALYAWVNQMKFLLICFLMSNHSLPRVLLMLHDGIKKNGSILLWSLEHIDYFNLSKSSEQFVRAVQASITGYKLFNKDEQCDSECVKYSIISKKIPLFLFILDPSIYRRPVNTSGNSDPQNRNKHYSKIPFPYYFVMTEGFHSNIKYVLHAIISCTRRDEFHFTTTAKLSSFIAHIDNRNREMTVLNEPLVTAMKRLKTHFLV